MNAPLPGHGADHGALQKLLAAGSSGALVASWTVVRRRPPRDRRRGNPAAAFQQGCRGPELPDGTRDDRHAGGHRVRHRQPAAHQPGRGGQRALGDRRGGARRRQRPREDRAGAGPARRVEARGRGGEIAGEPRRGRGAGAAGAGHGRRGARARWRASGRSPSCRAARCRRSSEMDGGRGQRRSGPRPTRPARGPPSRRRAPTCARTRPTSTRPASARPSTASCSRARSSPARRWPRRSRRRCCSRWPRTWRRWNCRWTSTRPTSARCRSASRRPSRWTRGRAASTRRGSRASASARRTKDGVISYQTVLEVDNDDLSLRPGMTGTAEITTLTREQALLVPNAALRFTPASAAAPTQGAQPQRRGLADAPAAGARRRRGEGAGRTPVRRASGCCATASPRPSTSRPVPPTARSPRSSAATLEAGVELITEAAERVRNDASGAAHPAARRHEDLRRGTGRLPGAARHRPHDRRRRVRRHHGPERLGQVHGDEHPRLPRHADRRQLPVPGRRTSSS